MITYNEARQLMERAQNRGWHKRRKLGNNTYLHADPSGVSTDYYIRLHATDIIRIHADGTFTLNTGGWETVTTKDRLNNLGPARIYSVDRIWCVISSDDPKTAPKLQKCRKCKGTGTLHIAASYRYWDYTDWRQPVRLDPPELISAAHDTGCWSCDGNGTRDYGSKPRPVKFYDGIQVDSYGKVIDANAERMYPTKEELDARAAAYAEATKRAEAEFARKQRAARKEWFAQCASLGKGEVIVYKAVNDDLLSAYQFRYPIGQTVECDDWRAFDGCGHGLHFCATPRHAQRYFNEATRYLACAVRQRDAVLITAGGSSGDKIKVKRARVLYEVDIDGNRLETEATANAG